MNRFTILESIFARNGEQAGNETMIFPNSPQKFFQNPFTCCLSLPSALAKCS